jgi:hypothetical protein
MDILINPGGLCSKDQGSAGGIIIFLLLNPFYGLFPLPLPSFHKQWEVVFSLSGLKFSGSPGYYLKSKTENNAREKTYIPTFEASQKNHTWFS